MQTGAAPRSQTQWAESEEERDHFDLMATHIGHTQVKGPSMDSCPVLVKNVQVMKDQEHRRSCQGLWETAG